MFALAGTEFHFVWVYHDRALIAFFGTILAEEIAKSFMIPEERAGTSELALYDSAWVLRRAEKFFELHSSLDRFHLVHEHHSKQKLRTNVSCITVYTFAYVSTSLKSLFETTKKQDFLKKIELSFL